MRSLRTLSTLRACTALRYLSLGGLDYWASEWPAIDQDEALQCIEHLHPTLTGLSVGGGGFVDARQIEAVAKLTSLRRLELPPELDDPELLAPLTSLRRLAWACPKELAIALKPSAPLVRYPYEEH